jgi:DNA-binding CsgD family transcriptional regulator
MLRGILTGLVDDATTVVERDKGVAFLTATCSIYQLTNLYYFCANIPRQSSGSFVQCAFGADFAGQAITHSPLAAARIANLEIVKLAEEVSDNGISSGASRWIPREDMLVAAIQLMPRGAETAVLGFSRGVGQGDAEFGEIPSLSELKVLGDYFHSHMLRRNGIDATDALVVSARELDCLRWVAAGKSAWEASVILGISERTVRFHLNSAREKLDCTTTTQAVAKVVARQLITIS